MMGAINNIVAMIGNTLSGMSGNNSDGANAFFGAGIKKMMDQSGMNQQGSKAASPEPMRVEQGGAPSGAGSTMLTGGQGGPGLSVGKNTLLGE